MSTIYLIIGQPKDATRMAKGSLKKWPNLDIDPVDNVSLAKLFVILTGEDYPKIIGSFNEETPKQPNVEPWDLENLIFPIYSIPEQYVRALAKMRDEDLQAFSKKWCKIEEFKWYKFNPSDLQEQLLSFREFAAKCIKKKHSLLLYLAP